MKLYEINAEIQRLADMMEVDEETGEVLCDLDAVYKEIDELQLEKSRFSNTLQSSC